MHELEQAEVDCRILLGAVELLEEAHAAHPLVEEADEHAVLGPDPAVLARQVLDDVVGGGGEGVLGRFDLVAGRAGRPGVDFELLNGLGDLIHELAGPRARQRRAQPAEQEQERRGGPGQRARGDRDEIDRNVRGDRRRRHRRRRDRGGVGPLLGGRGVHPVVPIAASGLGGRRLVRSGRRVGRRVRRLTRRGRRRGQWRGRIGDGRRRCGGRRRSARGRRRGPWPAGRRRRPPAAGIGADDGAVASAERIVVVAHRRSSLTAQSSIWSSGQSPAKCMPIAVAWLNSGQSGEVRSK